MTSRRFLLALGFVVLAGAGFAAMTLTRERALPAGGLAEDFDCTSCDARAASKARQREALQKARGEDGE